MLDEGEDEVVRVYCQPDRPKGRGKKLVAPPVKTLAEAREVPVAQPKKLKDGTVAAQMRADELDLAIVVAYGRILPPPVFEAPRFHTWNVHASLLPKYRGASPIQHAVLAGETETGVTLMQLSEGLDEGPMLLKRALAIAPGTTSGRLTEELAELGAGALIEGLRRAKAEGLSVEPQNDAEATFAPLIDKKDGALDFALTAETLARKILGFDPWPGTFVPTDAGPLKILSGEAVAGGEGAPGTILSLDPLVVATGEGGLCIHQLQAPGRKPLSSSDYLRGTGRHLSIGGALVS